MEPDQAVHECNGVFKVCIQLHGATGKEKAQELKTLEFSKVRLTDDTIHLTFMQFRIFFTELDSWLKVAKYFQFFFSQKCESLSI